MRIRKVKLHPSDIAYYNEEISYKDYVNRLSLHYNFDKKKVEAHSVHAQQILWNRGHIKGLVVALSAVVPFWFLVIYGVVQLF